MKLLKKFLKDDKFPLKKKMLVTNTLCSRRVIITVQALLLARRGRHDVIMGLSMRREKEERARAASQF